MCGCNGTASKPTFTQQSGVSVNTTAAMTPVDQAITLQAAQPVDVMAKPARTVA